MHCSLLPPTREIRQIVMEELTRVGGTEMGCYDHGGRLFLRATLPMVRQVRPRDAVKGGVAVMAVDEEIRVHPYTYRQVCRNGAIMARALQTRLVRRVEPSAPQTDVEEVVVELRDAVRASSVPEAFTTAVEQMRTATEREADFALHLFPLLGALPERHAARILGEIVERFAGERDRSVFGLMNAVTSVARDQREPEVRWRLEELGGGIPAMLSPAPKPDEAAAEPLGVEGEVTGRLPATERVLTAAPGP